MQSSGFSPPGAVAAPDLAEVAHATGPFASIYVVTESGIDNAAHRNELRWKTLRSELAEAGVEEDVLAEVDPHIPQAHLAGPGLAVIATAGGVLHIDHGVEAPATDRAVWAPLAELVPIIRWRQSAPPYMTVLADRLGADITVVRQEGHELQREAGGVRDEPIAKSAPGGWSQRRFQNRAENSWAENAEDVAEQIASLAREHRVRLIVIAGDVRALQLIRDALPDELLELVEEVEGGRSEDGSDEQFQLAVDQHVTGLVNLDGERILGKFREEIGQEDRAAEGPAAVMRALSMAQVDTLLIEDDPDDARTAWFGSEPNMIAYGPEALRAMGDDEPQEGRLIDILVRGALGTGASVRVLPQGSELEGGVGAILRWADPDQ